MAVHFLDKLRLFEEVGDQACADPLGLSAWRTIDSYVEEAPAVQSRFQKHDSGRDGCRWGRTTTGSSLDAPLAATKLVAGGCPTARTRVFEEVAVPVDIATSGAAVHSFCAVRLYVAV